MKLNPPLIFALLASAKGASAVLVPRAKASQDLCGATSFNEEGNWFCQSVKQILYSNVGTSGTYEAVTEMNAETGECVKEPKQYAGPLAPFNEPMSLHFRGPVGIKQVAVYQPLPGDSNKRVKRAVNEHAKRSAHHDLHQRWHQDTKKQIQRREKQEDQPDIWVTATIDGQVVSWANNYWGPEATSAIVENNALAIPTAAAVGTPAAGLSSSKAMESLAATGTSAPAPSSMVAPDSPASKDFSRTGYYNAAQQSIDGMNFLANLGGVNGSGRWTPKFGNTLSYVNYEGTGGAAEAQILADTVVPSGHEVILMTDQDCDESCGYVQEGAVGKKGFAGESKIILMEFSMPDDSDATGPKANMPAIWMLNAAIPLTSQYTSCSCWPDCGESDLFEVLAPGDTKCMSTFHSAAPGGDSNYFDRPLTSPVKAAVVFDGPSLSVSIKVLEAEDGMDADFPETLSTEQMMQFMDDSHAGGLVSNFKIVA